MLNIKNYTTVVPAAKSVEQIEKLLLQVGATHIMKQYGENRQVPVALVFQLSTYNMHLPIRLQPNITGCFVWLKKKHKQKPDIWMLQQAERIAWKHQYDLLHMQLSSLELEQAELLQIFLPNLYDPAKDQSFYDTLKSNNFKGLLPG